MVCSLCQSRQCPAEDAGGFSYPRLLSVQSKKMMQSLAVSEIMFIFATELIRYGMSKDCR